MPSGRPTPGVDREWLTPARGLSGGSATHAANGVSNGTRTRDHLDHNQVLYQLSYTHHVLPAR